MERQTRRILIVRTDRIGDLILTLPLAKVLKENLPGCDVSMLVRRYTAPLAQNCPDVDDVLLYDSEGGRAGLLELTTRLRKAQFDTVLHVHPRFPIALAAALAGIPLRVGTSYRWYSPLFNRKVRVHRKDALRHELDYNLDLVDALGCRIDRRSAIPRISVPSEKAQFVRELLAKKNVAGNEPFIVVHPGSGGSAREWSPRNFGELGKLLVGLPGIRVIVTGTQSEKRLVDQVCAIAGPLSIPVVNELDLIGYAALASLSALFIGNSTGPLHIAAAVGTPVIGLFPHMAPMTARRWGPVGEKKAVFTPTDAPADCTRCVAGKAADCECMGTIKVADVFETAKRLLVDRTERIARAIPS